MRQFELIDRVAAYTPNLDEDILNRAYVYAVQKHGTQRRASGDLYFLHPVAVAGILTDLKLDVATIVTALLHDTLEDTDATEEEISELFGGEVKQLVVGVTKLSVFELKPEQNKQAENFRKLFLAVAKDIRVLLVKLADRLHNMRTLDFIKSEEKRKRIATETLEVYAPLAGRMGIQSFRDELEDLAFKVLNPEARNLIIERLELLQIDEGNTLETIAYDIHNVLVADGVDAQVEGRQKRPFSIWRKMQNKSVSLEQLSDIFAFRVIVEEETTCYRALGAVHRKWSIVPGCFKDYISVPKLNEYRSIHTTIIGSERKRIEIQIKTRNMHEWAENGIAAHWLYKQQGRFVMNVADMKSFQWLQDIVHKLQFGSSAEEFMENTKMELFHDRVFCFTPKGRLIALPSGAMVLDFAYAVHTELGNHCVGAKINKKTTPLRTVLRNGYEVEIIRSDEPSVEQSWEELVVTGKARAAIKNKLRERIYEQHVNVGKEMLNTFFKANDKVLNDINLGKAFLLFECKNLESIYSKVGSGKLKSRDVFTKLFPYHEDKNFLTHIDNEPLGFVPFPIIGLSEDQKISIANNHFPLPGDKIVGIVTQEEGVTIYPAHAPDLEQFETQPEVWVHLTWDTKNEKKRYYRTRLDMTVINQIGTLEMVTSTTSKLGINIAYLELTHADDDFCRLSVDLDVYDALQADSIVESFKGSRLVHKIKRIIV